jgi:hypothetical protein
MTQARGRVGDGSRKVAQSAQTDSLLQHWDRGMQGASVKMNEADRRQRMRDAYQFARAWQISAVSSP